MPISKDERERFERQVRDLEVIESDDPGTPGRRRQLFEIGNRLRKSAGLRPFSVEDECEEEFPELGFFRRAKALGMLRIGRRST